jgi:hypothetical protein
MGRTSKVERLPAEQATIVDRTIRQFRYCNLDGIKASLGCHGIEISRSAIGRYMQKLEARDGLFAGSPNDTIVVIIERSTGSTATISTRLDKAVIASLIESQSASEVPLSTVSTVAKPF